MNTHNSFDERFVFEGKAKTWSLIAIAIGVIAIIAGFLVNADRTFSNLLLMGYYFTCVCAAGGVFCAIQYAAQAGWSASMIRIPQAFIKVLPIAAAILIVIIGAGIHFTHNVVIHGQTVAQPYLYAQWATPGLTDPKSPLYDPMVTGKSGFLNIPFFFIRLVLFLGLYSLIGWMLVKYSVSEDEIGGMSNYKKSFNAACVFLLIFGLTDPLFGFDAIMSLEARWYSTMFGWYNLAALWVSGLAVLTLTMILLKEKGYFSWLTEDHMHNMGLYMFAFSIFWTYVWFFQFLLTYYANIPEEAVYFYKRWEPEFKPWFWLNIVINFAAPFLMLMARDYKRKFNLLKWVSIIIILGHWLDYYVMIMPETVGPKGRGFWFEEVGIFIGFAGLFTFLMLNALSKFKSLVPKNHPFLEESLHHHI
ncbi:quinol:cytochrome c oxidoreductase quinone-binding subunit 2 [Mucilaginibacter mallensis]|uniref:Quinol:cytochrome c oxidoreductase quinone-binding subunit 2 n=1 Tax=Mucilaginibacter mallensis TaxID=652787 RepID=A0A1H2AZ24_MUCMA|nr:quinol:cytochrome C oxidoreductase [Mucilaginibacter mallensis]SDT51007.1 quinol:cytochrome c oxidoreductase quinone-binding subunit 2 [Mucilaginibacter mallensis]